MFKKYLKALQKYPKTSGQKYAFGKNLQILTFNFEKLDLSIKCLKREKVSQKVYYFEAKKMEEDYPVGADIQPTEYVQKLSVNCLYPPLRGP